MTQTAATDGEYDHSQAIDHAYPIVDASRVGQSIHKLHDHVCRQGRRVEITRPDCNDRCVMISKTELESMEQAIEILANTREFESLAQSIQQLLETAGVVYHPPA